MMATCPRCEIKIWEWLEDEARRGGGGDNWILKEGPSVSILCMCDLMGSSISTIVELRSYLML